jgi:hypothetical protein
LPVIQVIRFVLSPSGSGLFARAKKINAGRRFLPLCGDDAGNRDPEKLGRAGALPGFRGSHLGLYMNREYSIMRLGARVKSFLYDHGRRVRV